MHLPSVCPVPRFWPSPGSRLSNVDTAAKRLELLHELVPRVADVALLVDPSNRYTETELQVLNDSARTLGLQLNGHSGKFLILKSFWEARRGTFDFERIT